MNFSGNVYLTSPIDPSRWQEESQWSLIPKAEGFARESSHDYLLTFRSFCQFGHDSENLYFRITAFMPGDETPVMVDKYTTWMLDDGAEIYIEKDDGELHQLLFNAKGANIYFKNLALGGDLVSPLTVHGENGSGFWRLTLRLPLVSLGLELNGSFRIKIARNSPGEYLTHASEWGADDNGRPGVQLFSGDRPLTAEECAKAEEAINASFREYLCSLPDDPSFRAKIAVLPPNALKETMQLLESAKPATTAEEGRKLFESFSSFIYKQLRTWPAENTVDFSTPDGRIKRLNGTNGAPPLYAQNFWDLNDDFARLRMPCVRYHDDALSNPGMRLVDATLIFHRPDADASDPDNYYFEQTDDYVANTIAHNCDIIYRLGASIEHSKKKYFVKAPADYAQFAEICAGIIRHYNKGWANGFEYGIKYWEIWNEPDLGIAMWDRTMADYHQMYSVVAKRLKAEFPEIRIGGPATTTLNPTMLKSFLDHCHRESAPVDFISWHRYSKNPQELANMPKVASCIANDCGFPDAEFNLNEWHYLPSDFVTLRMDKDARRKLHTSPEGVNGIDSAAFNTMALTLWQDTPLTMSNFYMTVGSWGFYDHFHEKHRTYDGFLAFAPFADHLNRVTAASSGESLAILAGVNDEGTSGMILVSAFRMDEDTITVKVNGLSPSAVLKVSSAEADHPLQEHPFTFADGILTLKKSSGSAIFQILIDL